MKMRKRKISTLVATIALLGGVGIVSAAPNDHELPDENDIFWQVTSVMTRPDDITACQAKITEMANNGQLETYINQNRDELMDEGNPQGEEWQGGGPTAQEMAQGFSQMCTMLAQMPTQMQSDMGSEGVSSNIFNMSNWHNVSNLYFEKSGEGRISFTRDLDFMSYRFFKFMNGFGNMMEMREGYISLNAAMVPEMKNYGAQLTMFDLPFTELPDIYVDGQLAGNDDVANITWDDAIKSLTFTAKHFSSFRAVEKGSKASVMKITGIIGRKSVKYNANKSTFKVKVRGKNLKASDANTICTLGFNQATSVKVGAKGKKITCTFSMSDFSETGYYPLTVSIDGAGQVTRDNAIRVR